MATKLLKKKEEKTKPAFVPYEKENKVKKLKILICVVRNGQADNIINLLRTFDVALSIVRSGYGGSFREEYGLFGLGEHSKQVVISIIKEEKVAKAMEALEAQFKNSKNESGVAYTIPCTSVAGVSIYKFLTNTRKVKKVTKDGERK